MGLKSDGVQLNRGLFSPWYVAVALALTVLLVMLQLPTMAAKEQEKHV